MSKWKSRLMNRVLAVVLSGAMIMSDAALINITAYAAENGTRGGYSEETSEEYKPEEKEVKTAEKSDDKDADAGIVDDLSNDDAVDGDMSNDELSNDDTAGNTADDDTDDNAAAEPVDKADEAESKAEDSDENTTVAASAVETTVEKAPQETEEVVEEETSDVEVTEEAVDNQAQTGSVDVSKDLKTETDYGDDILKFYVLEDMTHKTDSSGVRVNNVLYKNYVVGAANPVISNGIPTAGAVFKIQPMKPSAITFIVGKSAKTGYFVKNDGDQVTSTTVTLDANNATSHTFDMEKGNTYYFYVSGSKPYVFAINWESKGIDESTRKDWTEVADPVISNVSLDADDASKINVTVNGVVGLDGADKMTVYMYDSEDNVKDSLVSAVEQNTTTFAFTPKASGTYKFQAEMARDTQSGKEKKSEMSAPITFTCPLVAPTNLKAESQGGGKVKITWGAVPEVASYIVEIADTATENPETNIAPVTSTEPSAIVTGLTKNKTYSFTVRSVKVGENSTEITSDPSKAVTCKVTDLKITWDHARYGNGVDTKNNTITGETGTSVHLISKSGKGKIVPASTDGLMFYYTKVSTDKNFTFSANAHVNSWTFSNGQEGFGVMAADTVGSDGTGGEFWNNSYQAVVSRISYNWNGKEISTDGTGYKVEMQIGVGSTEKIGVTSSDVSDISKGKLEVPKRFRAGQTAIDSTFAKYGTGQYNIVANCTNPPMNSDKEQYADFYLQVERNNTGYFVSYTKYKTDDKGNKVLDPSTTTTAKYYERDALKVLDENNIYVGVFTARNADITFSDMTLDVRDPEDDPKPEEKEVKYYNLSTSILSSTVTNSKDYQFIFHSNWNGRLVLKDSMGNILSRQDVTDENGKNVQIDYYEVTGSLDPAKSYLQDGSKEKNTKVYIDVPVAVGKNVFTVEYTPDRSWCPDKIGEHRYAELNSYEKVTLTYTVEYRKYGERGQNIYVSPQGKSTNIGTKDSRLDIYTAVKYAQPGQTIFLEGGTYRLNRTLQTPRGVDGEPDIVKENGEETETYKNYIKMMAEDPEDRPVLDFMSLVPAVVTVGNYWYFKNFDVTRCKDGEKGIQVSSSYCVFDRVDTYKNGSTGLQISRLASQDAYQDWPHDNLILNCNSYLNVDEGYEDADGFAAKLTSGSNNVFDGCIAAYNADDGWDLFAKVQSGSIGAVTIRNSIAYRNGWVLMDKAGNIDENGTPKKGKGNGNGFKMGGDGLQGGSIYDSDYDDTAVVRKSGHKIYNSLAFYNKMKGFDSNSCPNVKAYNCVSFNNEGSNIGFTSAAKNPHTDFVLDNVVSFRTEFKDQKDSVSSTSQDDSKWKNSTSYMWNADSKTSKNSKGATVSASDFVSLTYASLDYVGEKADWRNPDGTIKTDGFLSLKSDSPVLANAKPSIGGKSSKKEEDIGVNRNDDTYGDITGAIETETGEQDYGEDYPEDGIDKDSGKFGQLWVAEIKNDYTDKTQETIYYTGKQIMPELHVRFSTDASLLRKGKDYTVKYENNINASTEGEKAIAHVIGAGNYKGFTVDKEFKINPIEINPKDKDKEGVVVLVSIPEKVVVKGSDVSIETAKKEIKPTWQGKALKYDVDYTIEQKNANNTKEYTVKGKGNFTGEKDVTLLTVADIPTEKQDRQLSKATITIKDKNNITYTGSKIVPEVEVKMNGTIITKTDGFTIECANNLEIGKATLTVVGDGVNYFGSKSVTFNIRGGNLKDVAEYTYRTDSKGNAIYLGKYETEPPTFMGKDLKIPENTIIVKLRKSGTQLKYGIDYKIVQKGTNKAGNATVTIKGINGYTGAFPAIKFQIKPLDINDSSVVINPSDTLTYTLGGAKYENFSITIKDENGVENNVDSRYYTLSYKNNTKVATKDDPKPPTVIVKGRNGLTGTRDFQFNIIPAEMTTDTNIAVSAKDITTNGKELKYSDLKRSTITVTQSYTVKGKVKTKKLSAGRDYDKNKIRYYIDDGDFVFDETKDKEVTDDILSTPKKAIPQFGELNEGEIKPGYVTVFVKVGTDDTETTPENSKYNYKGSVVGYFRAALYDINKAKVYNDKARVYGVNWREGNGLSVAIDWSDDSVVKIDDYIDLRYKITGTSQNGNSTEEESSQEQTTQENPTKEQLREENRQKELKKRLDKFGPKMVCHDITGAYQTNTYNAKKYLVDQGNGFVIDPTSYKKNDKVGTASFTIVGTGQFAGTKKVTFKIISRDTARSMIQKAKKKNVYPEVEPFKYYIEKAAGENGTLEVENNVTFAKADDIIQLKVTPKDGYVFDKWNWKTNEDPNERIKLIPSDFALDIKQIEGKENEYQFTMPDADVSIKATFVKGYNVTVTTGGNGTATADRKLAKEGGTVELTATPDKGYVFDKWEVTTGKDLIKEFNPNNNPNTFTMPKGDVSIKATFKKEDA